MSTARCQTALTLSLSIVLMLATPCPAQNLSARIDAYVKTEMERQQIPGLSLAVVGNGKIAVLKSYGFSNLEHQIPVKPETIFQSGSIGKQFAATAIMILVAPGANRERDLNMRRVYLFTIQSARFPAASLLAIPERVSPPAIKTGIDALRSRKQ